ncbi:MAG TPA: hypothetical protein VJN96_01790 [Vicinamibacterales bacterium]|nr:hypothetical protein [Vicinamibacterales bacterium]
MSAVAGLHAQQTVRQAAQQQVNDDIERMLPQAMAEARAWTVGSLDLNAWTTFYRWSQAVQTWKKEANAGAAPLLAEGVLFDCLGRFRGVLMGPIVGEDPGSPQMIDDARPAHAVKAFDAALKINPQLIEARMRVARLRGQKDAKAASELERIANDQTSSPLDYLAAINVAALAHARNDVPKAAAWYERSLAINPRSTAAAIGLSIVKPATAVPFEALDANDLYYTYPCRVLTNDVAAALVDRIRLVVSK